ncbi:MAG TPA: DUF4962 domain-containing protein, partial [Planctomycetota bacterium]|nr:DUF4962 domain-containing protein [Planctomycetota bacterium]
MLTTVGYPTWGLGADDGTDLAAAHNLQGLAVGYDWLYSHLDTPAKQLVVACIEKRGGTLFDKLLQRQVWWHKSYRHNHLWANCLGLAAAGFALYGDVDNVDGFILLPLEKIEESFLSLPPDGTSHEGMPYWGYGIESLLKFTHLAKTLLNEDLLSDSDCFRNAASFRLYSMLPRNSWSRTSNMMVFGDGFRYDWYGPDFLLRRLAAEYNDSHAQWLANTAHEARITQTTSCYLNLLWHDRDQATAAPSDLPLFRYFDDLGIVFTRSGWNGTESVTGFKCGSPIGKWALEKFAYDPGTAHAYPDAGSLQLFAFGDWLLVENGVTNRYTKYHNTLLVNDIGQRGEGAMWFADPELFITKKAASILLAQAGDDYDYILADAADAYRPQAGLQKFLRHVIYCRPSCWVIIDEVQAAAPATFKLLFHSDFVFESLGGNTYRTAGQNGALRITSLLPAGVTGLATKQPVQDRSGSVVRQADILSLSNQAPAASAAFVTVLEAYATAAGPSVTAQIQQQGNDTVLVLDTPGKDFRFLLNFNRANPATPIATQLGSLALAAPNGGEQWEQGTSHEIRWDTTGSPGANVKLEYNVDAGNWIEITASTPNDGSYQWTVPNTPGACRVRVTSTSVPSVTDDGNATFRIVGAPAKLAFIQQPGNTVATEGATPVISPSPTVRLLDAFDYPTTAAAPVTVSLTGGAGSGSTLVGTATRTAAAGTATFDDLRITRAGTGFKLHAQADGLAPADSNTFSATALPVLTVSAAASPAAVKPGENITYTISYGNTGLAPASGVVISDTIPANASYVIGSASNGGQYNAIARKVTWSIGAVAAKTAAPYPTVSFLVKVTGSGSIVNGGTITNGTYSIDCTETAAVAGAAVATTVTDIAPPQSSGYVPAKNSIQVPRNTLIAVTITDAGSGVDYQSFRVRVNGDLIFDGANETVVDMYDTSARQQAIRGICRRIGTAASTSLVFQPSDLFEYEQTVTVTLDAADAAANAMQQEAYSFITAMRSFGRNIKVNSDTGIVAQARPAAAADAAGNVWAVWDQDAGDG